MSFTFSSKEPLSTALGISTAWLSGATNLRKCRKKILSARHSFGFSAGIVAVGVDESFESVNKRVSECLQIAVEQTSRRRVYWIPSEMREVKTPFQNRFFRRQSRCLGKSLFRRADRTRRSETVLRFTRRADCVVPSLLLLYLAKT